MSKYSKLFFQEKEYYEILPFRFPIYEDLVAGEAEGVESIARKQAQNTYTLLKIAKAVSKKKKISVKAALEMLSESDSDNEVLYEYAEELADIQKESATVAEQQIEMTSLFLRFRGEVKEGNDWKPVPDWTREDTLAIPSKMLNDIFEFINWERNGWPEEGK
tara:strand:- start:927 stop:1412 length:486 start_codon:yes stop_codon:yes gene_type:complete